jgi:2-polyprenyl-6-methoxyphenol hydroxylase-like FAD-dependent oxidoreductase
MKTQRALVIGGGFAGMIAARVLAEHFESVTVLDQDTRLGSTSPRTGAAQGAHLHVLLQRGQELLLSLFPMIESEISQCQSIDWANDTRWDSSRGSFPRYPSQIRTKSFSRPFLEAVIHRVVSELSNINFEVAQVRRLSFNNERVTQVECADGTRHFADLVVLAGGQHFPIERMLAPLPLKANTQTHPIHITYRSAYFATTALNFEDYKQYYYQLSPPKDTLGAVLCPVEDDRTIATIIAYGPSGVLKTDRAGFHHLAMQVPGGHFARAIRNAEPISGIFVFHKATMNKRHLHRVRFFPQNLFVVGDTLCSLNPVFGQGMTLALEQAMILRRQLKGGTPSSRRFHRECDRRSRLPFLLSRIGSSSGDGFAERYLQTFLSRCQRSAPLHRKFLGVLHLKSSYRSLVDPAALAALFFQRKNHD